MASSPDSPEAPAPRSALPSVFEQRRWIWPSVLGALIGVGLRIVFIGRAGEPYTVMMASFALLVPVVIGIITVVAAERTARRSWAFYFWASASANALCALVALLVAIEGIICVILAAPLFVFLGGIAGLITGLVCRLVPRPHPGAYGVVLLPLVFGAFEQHVPLPQTILSEERVAIVAAPAEKVWQQLLSARNIRPAEMNKAWMYRIGVPLPQSADTEVEAGKLVRHITMGRHVHFDQVATDWIPNRRIVWTYRFADDSFPPGALDDHVRIGGMYFNVIDTQYSIRDIPGGSELRVQMHYRVSTNFNWYVRPIAAFLVGNFEETALSFYARRAERRSEPPRRVAARPRQRNL